MFKPYAANQRQQEKVDVLMSTKCPDDKHACTYLLARLLKAFSSQCN